MKPIKDFGFVSPEQIKNRKSVDADYICEYLSLPKGDNKSFAYNKLYAKIVPYRLNL